MAGAKIIKHIMLEKGIKVKDVANHFGTLPQLLSNKLYKDNFTFAEFIEIVTFMDCRIEVVCNEKNKIFT
ncbi:MAG: hypothetical protein RR420_08520 [Anaerovoracaceae bacterium]